LAARGLDARPGSKLTRGVVVSLVLGAVVLFVLALVADVDELGAALRAFSVIYLAPVLLLTSVNYLIRFVRWQFYLRVLKVEVPLDVSAGVFFSGLAMAITPGKLGELVKCVMLRDRAGAPVALTAPVVIAERFTDLAAVLVLVSLGIGSFPSVRALFFVGLALIALVFIVLVFSRDAVDRLGALLSRSLLKGRITTWASDSSAAFRTLLTGRSLVTGLALGILGWFAECLAFWLVIRGFGAGASLFQATFIYALATLAGALSMLPGGLGATEASMAGLLVAVGVSMAAASGATIVIRACTLWWAVIVGFAAYLINLSTARRALAEISVEKTA
jgi:uncharacterized protein (TIRG00374 family)